MHKQFENSWGTLQVKVQVIDVSTGYVRAIDADLPYLRAERSITLDPFFDQLQSRGIIPHQSQIFHVDIMNRVNVFLGISPLNGEIKIGLQNIVNESLQFSFNPPQSFALGSQHTSHILEVVEESKPKKVKERKIIQAIQAVAMWRQLYQSADESGKRIYTLEQAARKVGIAKKTLDDYQIHLRAALEFNFNLERFKESKVGLLRKYIRIGKEEGGRALQQKMPECILDVDTDKYWVDFDEL